MDNRQRQDLDRYITGNYGEDQFSQPGCGDDWPEPSAHEDYVLSLPRAWGYDPADDGPESEVILRILASHPNYQPAAERRIGIFLGQAGRKAKALR